MCKAHIFIVIIVIILSNIYTILPENHRAAAFFLKPKNFYNMEAQTKLSKYAAKQQRLAEDPNYGTTYEVKTRDEELSEKQATAQPIDVAKVTAKIAAATADLHLLEAKIAKSRLNIERTLEVIKGQEAHAEALRTAIDKLNGKLQLNATV